MRHSKQHLLLRILQSLLPILLVVLLPPFSVRCQDSSGDSTLNRGDRAELSITVRDSSGEPISAPAMVKILRSGMPIDQGATRKGRYFYVLSALGDYSIIVDAPGYEGTQKDVSVTMSLKVEVEIYLKRAAAGNEITGVPGKPVLTPKAKEALGKGLQALNEGKLVEADKFLGDALKLAPENPEVLYVRGLVYLKQNNWKQAQSVLATATQLDPSYARAFAALGMALANDGKYDEAIAPLERSLQLDPGGWETHRALAKAYYHHEQYEAALKMSQEALAESHGAAPDVELLVAQSLTAVGRYEDAARALREFLKNHGDEPGAANARRWLERLTADGKIRRE